MGTPEEKRPEKLDEKTSDELFKVLEDQVKEISHYSFIAMGILVLERGFRQDGLTEKAADTRALGRSFISALRNMADHAEGIFKTSQKIAPGA